MMKSRVLCGMFLSLCLPFQALANPSTGLTFAKPEQLQGIPLASTPFSGKALPPKVDLSAHMPPPGQQGRQNSCVGWSTAYALKSYQEKLESKGKYLRSNGQLDPQKVFSPAFIYNQINNGRDGGSRFIDALNVLSQIGAATWSDMPYTDQDFLRSPTNQAMANAKTFRIDYWRRVNPQDIKEVKAQLNAGYPVLIGAMIDEGFVNTRGAHIWNSQIGASKGGHAMVLVGYDDTKKAFKLINSWGQEWGEKGYGWVDYGFFPLAVREAYVAKDALNTPTPQQPVQNPDVKPPQTTTVDAPQHKDLKFNVAQVTHNIKVSPQESPFLSQFQSLMKIQGDLSVPPGLGQNVEVVIQFYSDQGNGRRGKPLHSVDISSFSLPSGLVATSTGQYPLPQEGLKNEWFAFMPYEKLNLTGLTPQVSGQYMRYSLLAEATLYINGFGVKTAPLQSFFVQKAASLNSASGPEMGVSQFIQALHQNNYALAWQSLSARSQQFLIQLLQSQSGVAASELRTMFEHGKAEMAVAFWQSFKQNAQIDSLWVNQRFSPSNKISENSYTVLVSPMNRTIQVFREQGQWKMGFYETFFEGNNSD